MTWKWSTIGAQQRPRTSIIIIKRGIINMGSASTPRKNVRIGSAGYGWYVVCVNVRMGSAGSGAHTELLPILRNTPCRPPSLHATLRTA